MKLHPASSIVMLLLCCPSISSFSTTPTTATQRRTNDNVALQSTAIPTSDSSVASNKRMPSILEEYEHHTSDRLPYSPTGYATWEWETVHNAKNQERRQQPRQEQQSTTTPSDDTTQQKSIHKINYLSLGSPTKPALLLIHGFGASSYHFRYNIPILARHYHVYALDLLGFGWSDKPIMDYDASVWRDQVVDFVREIVLPEGEEGSGEERMVAIAGNSLGGYTAAYASSDERIKHVVKGCILLNAAGRFRDPEATVEDTATPNPIVKSVSAAIQRFVIACSFIYTKQPARITQILKNVYPINNANVDSELVESIQTPALDPNAAEVFYRVITKNGSGPQAYVDDILKEMECPVLLAWGESDPWIKSAAADKMERLHAEFHGVRGDDDDGGGVEGKSAKWIRRISVDAGHCPHDENPEQVNKAILDFVDEIF